jgi:hypothetical protein
LLHLAEVCGKWSRGFYFVIMTTLSVVIKNIKLALQIDMSSIQIKSESSADQQLNWLEVVRRQVGSLHYGVVQIVVHDSRVIQIEKTERVRLDNKPPPETNQQTKTKP